MESNSSSNIESDQNLKQNQGDGEKKSHVNDIDVVYFECKNCQNSFNIRADQENVDPKLESDTRLVKSKISLAFAILPR
jgi:hypothetical protein